MKKYRILEEIRTDKVGNKTFNYIPQYLKEKTFWKKEKWINLSPMPCTVWENAEFSIKWDKEKEFRKVVKTETVIHEIDLDKKSFLEKLKEKGFETKYVSDIKNSTIYYVNDSDVELTIGDNGTVAITINQTQNYLGFFIDDFDKIVEFLEKVLK